MGARRIVALSLLGLVAAGLTGCSSSDSGDPSPGMARAPQVDTAEAPPDFPASDEVARAEKGRTSGDAQRYQANQKPPPATDRKLARSAAIRLRAGSIEDAVSKVRSIASSADGFVGSEHSGKTLGSVSISVPSDKLDSVLGRLSKVGEVLSREVSVEDVTEQVADVDSRVRSQRASVARVRALLARAETIGEIVSIESELTSRESELEALLARQQSLAGRVEMSTVQIEILERKAEKEAEEAGGFLSGLSGGWNAFLTVGGALLTALGAMLPFLVALAVPVGLIWWLIRRRTRATRVPEPAASE